LISDCQFIRFTINWNGKGRVILLLKIGFINNFRLKIISSYSGLTLRTIRNWYSCMIPERHWKTYIVQNGGTTPVLNPPHHANKWVSRQCRTPVLHFTPVINTGFIPLLTRQTFARDIECSNLTSPQPYLFLQHWFWVSYLGSRFLN
jgi:hypothetical protein